MFDINFIMANPSGVPDMPREKLNQIAKAMLDAAPPGSLWELFRKQEVPAELLGEVMECTFGFMRRHKVTPDALLQQVLSEFYLLPTTGSFQTALAGLIRSARQMTCLAKMTDDDLVLAMTVNQALIREYERVNVTPSPDVASIPILGKMLARLARWSQYHFPVLRLTAQQSCALALSDLTEEQLESINPPWPAFVINFGDAFRISSGNVIYALVQRCQSKWKRTGEGLSPYGELWQASVLLSDGTIYWIYDRTTKSFYQNDQVGDEETDGLSNLNSEDERLTRLISRCCLNACVALSSKYGELRPARQRKRNRRGKKGKARPILGPAMQYELGMPVTVDMRQHVHRYLRGGQSRVFKVRWVVRGHWRNQAHGPGLKLRTMKWIAPYWKGPERGPKLVREHEMKPSDNR